MDANSDPMLIRTYNGKLTDKLCDCGMYEEVPQSAWRNKSVAEPCD